MGAFLLPDLSQAHVTNTCHKGFQEEERKDVPTLLHFILRYIHYINTMTSQKILIVLTSNDKLVNSDKKTGWYLPELAHPYYVFKDAGGFELVAASETGGTPPLDQSSVDAFKEDAESKRFLEDKEAQAWLSKSIPISQIKAPASEYAAIFYPGGHGPMMGLPENADSKALITAFYESKRIVSAVCHAPAVFSDVKLSNGKYLLEGRKVTSFSNEEEEQAGMTNNVPWL
jgi:putative intracellular protease/amidase